MKSIFQTIPRTIVASGLFAAALLFVMALLGIGSPVWAQTLTTDSPPHSSISSGICKGILSAGDQAIVTDGERVSPESCFEDGEHNFNHLARRIVNIFSVVVGAVSVLMIIIGGFRYIISGGDSTSVTSAKNTILYAIVGLVIVIFAQAIIRFVFTNVNPAAQTASRPLTSQT